MFKAREGPFLFEMKNKESHILQTYNRLPVSFERGKGLKLWDSHGKSYLDFVAGVAVDCLGHCHPKIVKVIKEQSQKLIHVSNLYQIKEQEAAATLIAKLSALDKVFFTNSGAESIEACIKFARFWAEKEKGKGVSEIIVTQNSFHGRTMGAISATGQKKYQKGFGPLLGGFKLVPYADSQAVEKAIHAKTAAILVETIQGEGGINLAATSYWKDLRKIANKNNILLILDEVQSGIGRTGKVFAFQNYGIKPDMMALAKGLGAGFPIGACVLSKKISKHLVPGLHGSTYGGNPLASRIVLEVLQIISQKDFLLEVKEKGDYFKKALIGLQKKGAPIQEVRGKGLMIAAELKDHYDGSQIVEKALEKGFLFNCIQNKILRFVPPLIVSQKEIDRAIKCLEEMLV